MKTLVLYAIIGSSALAVGAGGGFVYKRYIMDPVENVTGFNPDVCKPSPDLIETVDKLGSKKSAVNQLAPVDIANYATEKYKSYENSVSFCFGLADTIVKQDIRNAQIKNGNKYFEETISKSDMVGVGKRMYQEGIDGTLHLFHEKSKDDVTIKGEYVHTNFKDKSQDLTPQEYKQLYGRTIPEMFIYCVHSLTVLDTSKCTEIDGGYQVVLDLDPTMGGYQYRYQMKTISNLDTYPKFEFITLTYTLDENLDLVHIQAHEKYKATMMGISPNIENTLEYDFFPNVEWKIPEVGEDVDYKSLKEMVR